jgi:hypothetical protein
MHTGGNFRAVDQRYKFFPRNDYRNNGQFKGFIIQAVVGF